MTVRRAELAKKILIKELEVSPMLIELIGRRGRPHVHVKRSQIIAHVYFQDLNKASLSHPTCRSHPRVLEALHPLRQRLSMGLYLTLVQPNVDKIR